jgi:hypothetical protein
MGHNEEQCEKRARGSLSIKYDATLRCSPKRKYEGRSIATPDEPAAKRSVRFTTSAGSVDSSSLGRPNNLGTTVFGAGVTMAAEVPDRVDAHDGFDMNERCTEPVVEGDLVDTVDKL